MKELNQYVKILDETNVISCGKYKVGKDLPAGEYYIWGGNIEYSYVRKADRYSYENGFDGYAVFEKGDRLNFENGLMTPIENITYVQARRLDILLPNHVYRIGTEIPLGFYVFKFDEKYFVEEEVFLEKNECAIDLYEANSDSRRTRERGKYGCVEIINSKRHAVVINGVAKYYGKTRFDEIGIIEDKNVPYNEFNSDGKMLFSNDIIDLRLFLKHSKGSRFCGKVMMNVYCYYWYAINGNCMWKAKVYPFSGRGFQTAEIIFSTGDGVRFYKKFEGFKDIVHVYNDKEYNEYYVISANLPDEFYGKEVFITLCSFNDICVEEKLEDYKNVTDYLEASEIRKYYATDFIQLESLLNEMEGLDVERELKYFDKVPDIINKIIPTLEDIINAKNMLPNAIYSNEDIQFRIKATYNKVFYCAAKLADEAKAVYSLNNGTEFDVIYDSKQLEQIEMMYYILFHANSEGNEKVKDFLQKRSYIYYTIDRINQCIAELADAYGYSSLYRDSVLIRIIKNENKKMQKKMDKIYSDIVKEDRVPVKWGNEYRLFSLISNHNIHAQYQYHCDWLGQQSLDIYIETARIGIEYQGEQHYKAVSIWGGEEGLKENQERDLRKKKLCKENGVQLLEWSYQQPVNDGNVIKFMKENQIPFIEKESEKSNMRNEMAPVIRKEGEVKERKKSKKQNNRPIKYYVVQYDMEGRYVERFTNIGSAAKFVGISATSISKVLRGERNSAAGYIWKKCNVHLEIPQKISVEFDISKTNSGMAKRIALLGKDGVIMNEFDSIADAVRLTKISSHHIQNELTKENSAEWKYL